MIEALIEGKKLNAEICLKCDLFIKRCKEDLITQDLVEAIKIREEASSIFQDIIPGWYGGLMAPYTGFYLDDVEMILGKLCIFRTNQMTSSAKKPYHGLTQIVNSVMNTHEAFEQAIDRILHEPFSDPQEQIGIIYQVREYQKIAESQMSFDEKWNQTRPFIVWISSLDARVARHLLPIIAQKLK